MNTPLQCCWALFLVAFQAGVVSAAENTLRNRLADHPSPYLSMHANDPVHWQPWDKATLQRAQTLNRPILVSIGYFACHWCHVMQRESYQNPELAALLNRFFVPVKVDRELNPALDAYLIEFVQLTRGQAGWPLNVLLTPDGYPMLGVTYLPRDRFFALLTQFRQRWSRDEKQLRKVAYTAMQEWRTLRRAEPEPDANGGSPGRQLLVQARQLADELEGGFGQANKFPMSPQLAALLDVRGHADAGDIDAFIRITLDRMASQGMHDNLGGGFFRYVVDPGWQVPHYEKMLYDNAQLAVIYLRAAELYDTEHYRRTGLSTVDFMLREMARGPVFVSSFSAVDDQGREGFYYQWSDEQLRQVLDDRELAAVLAAWFGVQAAESEYGRLPRWQGDVASIAKQLDWSQNQLQQALESARKKMLAQRAGRALPVDDKALAAWNGLALSALARAYAVTGDSRYAEQAVRLADYLGNVLWDGERLLRARRGRQLFPASLEDYALVAQGLWDWDRQHPEKCKGCGVRVEKLVRTAWQRYFRDGRWLQSDTPLIPMLGGKLAEDDGALPSASAVIARISAGHPLLRNDRLIRRQLERHLEAVRAQLGDSLFWYASYVELLAGGQR